MLQMFSLPKLRWGCQVNLPADDGGFPVSRLFSSPEQTLLYQINLLTTDDCAVCISTATKQRWGHKVNLPITNHGAFHMSQLFRARIHFTLSSTLPFRHRILPSLSCCFSLFSLFFRRCIFLLFSLLSLVYLDMTEGESNVKLVL